jgi:hypothetical protein
MGEFYSMKMMGTILMVILGLMFDSKVDKGAGDNIAERETVETIQNAKGIVWKGGDDDVYTIECAEKHIKLNVINLPEKYRKNETTVIFSGNIKLTHPLEDNWGEFFEVTAITK